MTGLSECDLLVNIFEAVPLGDASYNAAVAFFLLETEVDEAPFLGSGERCESEGRLAFRLRHVVTERFKGKEENSH